MRNDIKEKIKQDDKKSFKEFIMIVVIGSTLGFVFGIISSKNPNDLTIQSIYDNIVKLLLNISPYASIVLSFILLISSAVIFNKVKKSYESIDENEENDEMLKVIDKQTSYLSILSSINLILGFFFFAVVSMKFDNLDELYYKTQLIEICIGIVGFLIVGIISTITQKKLINFEKERNPLLKGSIYDKNFQKKWLDSCDESIQLTIYKSGYKAYTTSNNLCLSLMILLTICNSFIDIGIMPFIVLTIVTLVQSVVYILESMKY